MKKICMPLLSLLIAGCSSIPVQSRIAACPMTDIKQLTFFSGPPVEMASLAPDDETKEPQVWTFGSDAGNIYLKCEYHDGSDIVQKLPPAMDACRISHGADGKIKDLICDAGI